VKVIDALGDNATDFTKFHQFRHCHMSLVGFQMRPIQTATRELISPEFTSNIFGANKITKFDGNRPAALWRTGFGTDAPSTKDDRSLALSEKIRKLRDLVIH
jgi:hypothetical protein